MWALENARTCYKVSDWEGTRTLKRGRRGGVRSCAAVVGGCYKAELAKHVIVTDGQLTLHGFIYFSPFNGVKKKKKNNSRVNKAFQRGLVISGRRVIAD